MNLKGHTSDLLCDDHHRPGTTAGQEESREKTDLLIQIHILNILKTKIPCFL